MERGAVEGKVFHAGAVSSLVPEPLRAQVRPRLLTLARKELIRPDRAEFAGEDAFRFRHLLIRDTAYHAMPKEQRADLHARFAEWLERVADDRAHDYVEIIGHHLEQAWRYRRVLGIDDETTGALGDRGAQALRGAADRSSIRSDLPTATQQLERAVEMATGAQFDEAMIDLAEVQLERSAYHPAIASAAAVSSSEDPLVRIRAEAVRLAAVLWTDPTSLFVEVRTRFEELHEQARRLGSQEIADRCELAVAQIAFFDGHIEDFNRIARGLLPRVGTMNLAERRVIAFAFASSLAWGPEQVSQATDTPDVIERIYEGSLLGRAVAQMTRTIPRSMADDGPGFDETIEQLDALYRDLGDPSLRYLNAQPRLEALWRLGRGEEAVEWGTAAKGAYDRIGETGSNSTITAMTAYYAIQTRSLDLGAGILRDARAMASSDDFATHVPIAWGAALLASARDDHETALAEIGRAFELIVPTDYLTFHGETERVHWQVLLAAGREAEADAAFDEALAMYERKGDVASIRRLREQRDRDARIEGG